ncbi:MAG: hypothetical protein KDD94_10120, partial [Calditrichaeota bacterium]|nr:hypothetical protein [Calditrichota bacterium]
INENLIAIYEPAFSEKSLQKLHSFNCDILSLSEEDANSFALNSIVIKNHIIIHSGAEKFSQVMRSKDYIVHNVDISEFLKFGGGLKCLSLQHYI